MLNQTIDTRLAHSQSILIAGGGGGYDVVCGAPIALALARQGKDVHIAGFSSTPINDIANATQHSPFLVEVTARSSRPSYFPEGWLAKALSDRMARDVSVWCMGASGVGPLLESYTRLVRDLSIDTIILVDGGVDSLLRGDENALGSPLEDAISLAALSLLEGPQRILAAVAFGAERLDQICHAQVLARVAALTNAGAWLGCECLEGVAATDLSEIAEYILQNQRGMRQSIVIASLISAIRGDFGDVAVLPHATTTPPWISPLTSLFWYFDLPEVARQNLYLSKLINTTTYDQAAEYLGGYLKSRVKRGWEAIPI